MLEEWVKQDFEILIIDQWVNPDIGEYFESDLYNPNEGEWDSNCFRIWMDNKSGKMMHLVVKSEVLQGFWDDEGNIVMDNEAVTEYLRMVIEVSLLEDVWCPGGPQFCFTTFGKKVAKFFKHPYKISFSPDIAICKEEDGSYSDHS